MGNPPAGAVSTAAPTTVTLVNGPTIRIASVAGVAAPAAPTGSLTVPDIVLPGGTTSSVTVNLEAVNILGEIEGPALDATDQGNLTPTGGEGPGVTASPGCGAATVYAHVNGLDQLANTVDDTFTLAAGSPAIDRGRDLGTLGLPSALTPRLEADFSREAARPRAGTTGGEALFDLGAMQMTLADTAGLTVTFLQPAAGAHVRQTVTVQAQATDEGRGVATLALTVERQTLTSRLSPTPPGPSITAAAPWDSTSVEDGAHMLTATAENQATTPGDGAAR